MHVKHMKLSLDWLVSGLCPSSGSLKEQIFHKLDLFPTSIERTKRRLLNWYI